MPPKKRGNEVQLARGRLKGVLQDLVAPSDDEQSEVESEKKAPSRGRPSKRRKEQEEAETPKGPPHESYIMKLFDRSLDLAKFNENTPLYPICRAWIADQPNTTKNFRNLQSPPPTKRESGTELLRDLKDGVIDEITAMPAPKNLDIPRIPSPVHMETSNTEDEQPSREVLLAENLAHWRTVRKKWINHSKARDQKYIASMELLEALYIG